MLKGDYFRYMVESNLTELVKSISPHNLIKILEARNGDGLTVLELAVEIQRLETPCRVNPPDEIPPENETGVGHVKEIITPTESLFFNYIHELSDDETNPRVIVYDIFWPSETGPCNDKPEHTDDGIASNCEFLDNPPSNIRVVIKFMKKFKSE